MRDLIADLIIKIKNANMAGHETVTLPYSKIGSAVLEVLEKEGYVQGLNKKGKKITKSIEVGLVYEDGKKPRITGVERVSKFSKRVYQKAKEIRSVRSNFGMLVLTTPKGILTDKEARKEKVGGEALFKIW
ncbi:MAG TPA: 30S ribosomal protein S8 [Candidatus Paceibacterota bacterium]|nr:30S ribosomal protein S8 [Candidatus Paceibacterota bacterium]